MRRVIVDYKKLNEDILDLLVDKFPRGYSDSDIISFRNLKNELIEAVEVRDEETIYLVKVGVHLGNAMENHEDLLDDDDDDNNDDGIIENLNNSLTGLDSEE